METKPPAEESVSRRKFVREGIRAAGMTGIGVMFGLLAGRATAKTYVWQIDPAKCLRCDKCATDCVLAPTPGACIDSFAQAI